MLIYENFHKCHNILIKMLCDTERQLHYIPVIGAACRFECFHGSKVQRVVWKTGVRI